MLATHFEKQADLASRAEQPATPRTPDHPTLFHYYSRFQKRPEIVATTLDHFLDFLVLPQPSPFALSQASGEHAQGEEHTGTGKERICHAACLHPTGAAPLAQCGAPVAQARSCRRRSPAPPRGTAPEPSLARTAPELGTLPNQRRVLAG